MDIKRIVDSILKKTNLTEISLDLKIYKDPEEFRIRSNLPQTFSACISKQDGMYTLHVIKSKIDRFTFPFILCHEFGYVIAAEVYGFDEIERRTERVKEELSRYRRERILSKITRITRPLEENILKKMVNSLYIDWELATRDLISDYALFTRGLTDELTIYKQIKISEWFSKREFLKGINLGLSLPSLAYAAFHPSEKIRNFLKNILIKSFNFEGGLKDLEYLHDLYLMEFPPSFKEVVRCYMELFE